MFMIVQFVQGDRGSDVYRSTVVRSPTSPGATTAPAKSAVKTKRGDMLDIIAGLVRRFEAEHRCRDDRQIADDQ